MFFPSWRNCGGNKESLPKQWHCLAAEAKCLLGCSQPYPSGWKQRFPVEIPPWINCHFRFLLEQIIPSYWH